MCIRDRIKRTNCARASLEELLADYRDFLRTRNMRLWDKDSKEALFVRNLGHGTNVTYETYSPFVETRPPEVVANIIICLVHQANYLLDRQLRRLEQDFLEHGGLRKRMTQARLASAATSSAANAKTTDPWSWVSQAPFSSWLHLLVP